MKYERFIFLIISKEHFKNFKTDEKEDIFYITDLF